MQTIFKAGTLLASALALAFAAPASATVVTMNISGNWQPLNGGPLDPFTGTISYDTSTLSYVNGNDNSTYGNSTTGLNSGSYNVSWDGLNYSAPIGQITVAYQTTFCNVGFVAPCLFMDFNLLPAERGFTSGRMIVALDAIAPFNSNILPDVAFSSANAVWASFQLFQTNVGDRYTTVGFNPTISQNATGGATLSFGPAGAVPEPASWLMLILGFGLAGTALRTRTRGQTAAIA